MKQHGDFSVQADLPHGKSSAAAETKKLQGDAK